MSRSSARRGQTEPLAALAAVFAVGIAVSLYAGAVPDLVERPDGAAETTLSRVYRNATTAGVVVPGDLPDARSAGPPGKNVNVTLTAGPVELASGPTRPPDAANATRPVGVRVEEGDVEPGRLSVGVWT